jgi:hypothetical protein
MKKPLLAILFLSLASVVLAQDRLTQINEQIAAFEKAHPMKYVAGQVVQVITVPDGTVGYLLCPRQDGRCDRYDKFIAIAHPAKPSAGMSRNPYGAGMVGTTPDGKTTYQNGWFVEAISDGAFIGGLGLPVSLYDTKIPPEIAKLYDERAPLLEAAKTNQESTQRTQEKEFIKTVETRTIKIEVASIEWRGEQGLMLYVMPGNGLPQPSDCRNCNPIIYVTADVASKIGDREDWEKLTLGYPAGNALPDPGYSGYVHGAYATADVFPCKVKGSDASTCLADIRDIQPNRKRYNGAL